MSAADTRRDTGDFYPGGKRVVTTPVAMGGDVKHSDFADVTVETNTMPKMRQAIETLAQKLGATVAAIAIAVASIGAGFDSVPVNDIDFDENPSVVTNVTFDGLLQAETDPSWAARSNAVMQAVWSLGSLACLDALGWSDITNKPSWIGSSKPTYTLNEVAPNSENWLGVQGNAGRTIKILAQGSGSSPAGGVQVTASTLNNNNTTTYAYSGVAVKRNGTNTDYLWDETSSSGIVRRSELDDKADADDLATLSASVTSISAMLNAENARFVSTNYNSATQIPSASVEAKIDGSWLTIWNELTRWTWLTDEYLPGNFYTKAQTDAAIADKADRAWGFYDPMTGDWAPEDCIWLSAPKVYVCAGGAYERVAETTGYWVLTANGMVANINGTTNGFFRISDSSNETQFEIVKSDKRTLFAHMTSMESVMGVSHYRTTYAITNAVAAPTANFARALGDGQQSWFDTDPSCPMNAIWEQTASNEWTLEWWPKSYEKTIFVEAFYEQGGETFIRNVAPISVEGGILCTDGIHKCRPVYNNGSVTWEVVQ